MEPKLTIEQYRIILQIVAQDIKKDLEQAIDNEEDILNNTESSNYHLQLAANIKELLDKLHNRTVIVTDLNGEEFILKGEDRQLPITNTHKNN